MRTPQEKPIRLKSTLPWHHTARNKHRVQPSTYRRSPLRLNFVVVQELGNFSHAYDGSYREAILFLDFLLRSLHAALANFHTVQGDNQTLNLNISGTLQNGVVSSMDLPDVVTSSTMITRSPS